MNMSLLRILVNFQKSLSFKKLTTTGKNEPDALAVFVLYPLNCLLTVLVHMCLRLRTLLKTAKKKLRDQETGGAEFGSPMSSLRMDVGRHSQADGAFGRMKDKVCVIQHRDFSVNPQVIHYSCRCSVVP